jgi:hypothetical protein
MRMTPCPLSWCLWLRVHAFSQEQGDHTATSLLAPPPCSAGFGAAAFMGPLLQNLCLSKGDNEEACFCLKVCHLPSADVF